MNRVKAGIFSFTPATPADDDGSYLRWHLLDHMPEQYQLPGMVLGQRWTADAELQAARLAGDGALADIGNVVNYLIADPVQETVDDFMALGKRLAEVGRFPERRPSIALHTLALQHWQASPAALISAEVVPFRPHRGVLLLAEEGAASPDDLRSLVQAPGTAGAWNYGPGADDDLHVTVVYLDGDPARVAKELAPLVERRWATGHVRPLFAGPLRSMIEWEAWPS